MKKYFLTLLILVSIPFFNSCSNDDDDIDNCSIVVKNLNKACAPDCIYSISYGTDESLTSIETNQATFDYYTIKFNENPEKICWEGEK